MPLPARRDPAGPLAHRTPDAWPARDRHPDWCARGHHCTADRLGTRGEHASVPEIWQTKAGRIVATRYRRPDGTRDRMELRAVIDLDPDDEHAARQTARAAIVAVHLALSATP